ncbi:hypothetical protein A9Q87_05150 [Flavobacteriales bacterium 34_180_T64]|nr:hypothetical protein A9Q87_05150 [Flavobacteriales bacterium 34_180_T64]
MKKFLFFIVLLVGSSFTIQAQTVRIVDNNQGAATGFTTIDAAIQASQPMDTIYVQPSPNTYPNVNINKPINIYGIGHNPELNAGQYAYIHTITFSGAASGTKISGLFITTLNLNTNNTNHDVVITNNRFNGTITGRSNTSQTNNIVISGNYFEHGSTNFIDNNLGQNWIISNNLMQRSGTNWSWNLVTDLNNTTIFNNNIILSRQIGDTNQQVEIFATCNGTQISNNIIIFTGNSVANMNIGANLSLTFNNNLTYSVVTAFDALGGSNFDDVDPQFVSFDPNNSLNNTTHDYNIQGGAPHENMGSDGNNLGVMNGVFPFSLRGYPTELPYLTDFVIFNNILSEGTDLNINIKADANNN